MFLRSLSSIFLLLFCSKIILSVHDKYQYFSGNGQNQAIYSYNLTTTRGLTSTLFCNILVPDLNLNASCYSKNDKLERVLWFKNDSPSPIFAYYIKRKNLKLKLPKMTFWSDHRIVQNRASFDVNSSPACLKIENVDIMDTGNYSCRVDYRCSPTTKSFIQLKVIVPPKKTVLTDITLTLFNNTEHYKSTKVIGPYKKGDDIKLLCSVNGGFPSPKITWIKNQEVISTSFTKLNYEKVQSILSIPNIKIEDEGAIFTCLASNGASEVYSSAKLKLLVNYRDPIAVFNTLNNIVHINKTMTEDKKYTTNITMNSSCSILSIPYLILVKSILLFCLQYKLIC